VRGSEAIIGQILLPPFSPSPNCFALRLSQREITRYCNYEGVDYEGLLESTVVNH